jgi:hypothetical protein
MLKFFSKASPDPNPSPKCHTFLQMMVLKGKSHASVDKDWPLPLNKDS